MKMCIILLLILISGNLIALPDYSKFYELTSTLNDAASDSVKNIIICGNAGTILISNDAGNTWEQKFVNSTNDFSDVEYLYDSTFIILNKKSNIYKTTDAGNNWSSIPIQATSEMTSLSFKNNIGIIACDDGSVFISRDAAETWVTQQISYTGFQKVLCTNDKFLVLDNNNTLFVSDKSDINWNQFQINSSMNKCKDIYEDSSGNYFLICDSLVVKLDKNFNTINELETHTACNAIDQIDSNNYYLYSFDYGLSISDKRLERYILSYIENQPMLRQDSIINDTNHIIYKGNINKTIKISDSILLTIGTRKSIFISKDCGFSWGMKSFYSLLDPYDSKNLPIVRYTDNNIFIGLPKFGLIYCSTNQGATWTYQKLSQIWYEAISNLYDMDFIDDSTGIAIGDASKGRFWFTGNSAESFEYTSVEQESFSNSKLAIADKNHYAFSKWYDSPGQALHTVNSSIIVTKDNLSSFNKTIFDSCYVFNLISINDSSYLATLNYFQYKNEQGDSVPTKQIIIRTKDYGNTWENISYPGIDRIKYINFNNENQGFVIYYNYNQLNTNRFARTENGGISWFEILTSSNPLGENYRQLNFLETNKKHSLFTGNSYDTIYETKDYGITYDYMTVPQDPIYYYSSFVKSFNNFKNDYYIITANNKILRTVNYSGDLEVEEKTESDNLKMILQRAYPIPFTNTINIPMFWIQGLASDDFQISIYNTSGDLIENLSGDAIESSGNCKGIIKWTPKNNVTSGTYIISVKVANSTSNLRVLYVK